MLYEVKPGACARSYGVAVARLARFPAEIVEEAEAIASQLEYESARADARVAELNTSGGAKSLSHCRLDTTATVPLPLSPLSLVPVAQQINDNSTTTAKADPFTACLRKRKRSENGGDATSDEEDSDIRDVINSMSPEEADDFIEKILALEKAYSSPGQDKDNTAYFADELLSLTNSVLSKIQTV
jgi:predicted Zn-dependent protease